MTASDRMSTNRLVFGVVYGFIILCWAGFLLFFTLKGNPYELGWLFISIGGAGTVAFALFAGFCFQRAQVKGKEPGPLCSQAKTLFAYPPVVLVGWTGALTMAATDASAGSVFMVWAMVFSIAGVVLPVFIVTVVTLVRAPADGAEAGAAVGANGQHADAAGRKLDPARRKRLFFFYGIILALCWSGAILCFWYAYPATLFTSVSFWPWFGTGLLVAGISVPTLTEIIVSLYRRPRKLVLMLMGWLVGTLLMMVLASIAGLIVHILLYPPRL